MILCLFYLIHLVAMVAGHGFVKSITVDGQEYPGFDPTTDLYQNPVPDRIMRKIPNDGPVRDMTSTDLTCNTGGQSGSSLSANVKAGGTVVWKWNQWLSDHLGPVLTMMAACNGKCADVNLDSTTLNWFKIDEKAFDPNGSGSLGQGKGRWGTEDLSANGNQWASTIPAELASGEYLMRHEAVALHSNPAQPYPACIQVVVSGDGSKSPSGDEVVQIPGPVMYSNFKWPVVWNNVGDFKAPGPPIAAIAQGAADPVSGGAESGSAPAGTPTTAAGSNPTRTSDAVTVSATRSSGAATTTGTTTAGATSSQTPAAAAGSTCSIRRNTTSARMKKRHTYRSRSGH